MGLPVNFGFRSNGIIRKAFDSNTCLLITVTETDVRKQFIKIHWWIAQILPFAAIVSDNLSIIALAHSNYSDFVTIDSISGKISKMDLFHQTNQADDAYSRS